MAYYQLEPWGDQWRQAGMLASIVANIAGRADGQRPFEPDDFIPTFEDRPKDCKSEVERLIAFGKTLKEKPKGA